jgi:hypothetical protein
LASLASICPFQPVTEIPPPSTWREVSMFIPLDVDVAD